MALFLLSPVLPPKVQLLTLEFEFSALSLLQLSCPSVQAMLANTSLQVLPIPYRNSTVLCDVSSSSIRHLVPTSLWKQLFSALYRISHPGVLASSRLFSSRFIWPSTAKDIGLWSWGCIPCKQNKIQTHIKSSWFQAFQFLDGILLTFTLISIYISCFGVPTQLTSNHGIQFTSFVWARVCETLKISHSTTTSFHLQFNGMIERFYRSLKSSLQARLAGQDWVQHLPQVLLGLIATSKEDSVYILYSISCPRWIPRCSGSASHWFSP